MARVPQLFVLFVVLLVCAVAVADEDSAPAPAAPPRGFQISVTDENHVAVPGARVAATTRDGRRLFCETDHSGRCVLNSAGSDVTSLVVEKKGFYRAAQSGFAASAAADVTLVHEEEVRESVDVVESPPGIDAAATANTETLTAGDILNVPYPTSRDIRNVLPLMPQVVADMSGNIHIGGSSITQELNVMDGFNITETAPALLPMHVNADAVRTIDAEISRYSAEYGKGSSVLAMTTGMGDDRYRFSATNFVPSVQFKKGLSFDKWVPRFVASGPIKRGKIWFYEAPDFEYNLNIVPELPDGADRSTLWKASNLTKVQINIVPANILTAEFLGNTYTNRHAGLAVGRPLETTINTKGSDFLAGLRDQHYFKSGSLLELAFGMVDYTSHENPLGFLPFQITPDQANGSFYRNTYQKGRRYQAIANYYLRPLEAAGKHEVKFGFEVDRLNLTRDFHREPIQIFRENGTLARTINFIGGGNVNQINTEYTGYGQDRWTPSHGILIETGLRYDWDEVVRRPLFTPRVAASYLFDKTSTKLTAGFGLYYGATNLEILSRAHGASRLDTFYAPDGTTVTGSAVSTYSVNRSQLSAPRTTSWSFGIEQKLPRTVIASASFVNKRGDGLFGFYNPTGGLVGNYTLANIRDDRYRAFQVSFRHNFRESYPILVSYTHSLAKTNTIIDYSVDNVALSQQFAAPLPWDTPNRVLAWGWAPFIKKFVIGYVVDVHDGQPYLIANQEQVILSTPNPRRFPRYFQLTLSAERRFHLFGMYLALRGTLENVTNNHNPTGVFSNVDSPNFGTFTGLAHRTANFRIRFLGRSGKGNAPPKSTTPQDKP